MRPEIKKLREDAEKAKLICNEMNGRLAEAIRNCKHEWGKTVYDPIRHDAYTIPGDPPGVGGIDRQLPCYAAATTIDRWTRTCELCGKVQETKNTRKEEIKYPDFGN